MADNNNDLPDWNLTYCCGTEEKAFLIFYVVYHLIILALWRTQVLKPLKLLAVLVHELGHASAAWLTCGKVKSISVNGDESGLASYSGGVQCIVIPGGYVGGAFWGAAFVALSGNRIGSTVAACIISSVLIIALAHNPNKLVVYLAVGFAVVTILAILVEWFIFDPFLQFFTLFYGVFLGYYACRDIWDDTVTRNSEGSDAQACHKMWPCCLPRMVGVQFLILAILFQVIGLWLGLVWLVSTDE